jgi:hypothetical protein
MDTPKAEGENCMNTSTPVLPVVANGFHGHHDRGIEGKDAVLVHGLNGFQNDLSLNETISRNSKENACISHENRFQLGVQAEKLERENQRVMKEEHQRTRDLILSQEEKRLERERVDSKFAALEALIATLKK